MNHAHEQLDGVTHKILQRTIVRLVKRGLMDRTSGFEYLDFLGLIVRRRSRLLITQLADNEKHPSS